MKKIFYKLLHPNKIIGGLLCLVSTALLIYVFSAHLEQTILSYIAYLMSTYSLIIFIIWFCKVCEFSSDFIKSTKIYAFYEKNKQSILKISLLLSSILNFIYGLFKLGTGFYYKSWWFITFAIYYLILCIMRTLLIKDIRNTGIILLILNVVLIGMIILIIRHDYYFSYPGYLIYVIAIYDFYLIISAFINVFKYKKNKSPIISASKYISLTVAMISILSLEIAMIYQFGNNDRQFKLLMVFITGFGICLINSFMAFYMIVSSNKSLKNKKITNH